MQRLPFRKQNMYYRKGRATLVILARGKHTTVAPGNAQYSGDTRVPKSLYT